jgi:hypothetical protein
MCLRFDYVSVSGLGSVHSRTMDDHGMDWAIEE